MEGVGVSRQEGWLGTLAFLGQPLFIHTETLPPAGHPWDSVSRTVFTASLRAAGSPAGVERRSWEGIINMSRSKPPAGFLFQCWESWGP